MSEILQTSQTSIIFSATSTASFINGTGIKGAAVCNKVKACFPVALIYCVVVGMTSPGLSDDSWISDVRQRDGRIRIYYLTAALEFVSVTWWSSTEVGSFVVEVIGSISGSSCTQKCVREV